jgi:hypothetical protein
MEGRTAVLTWAVALLMVASSSVAAEDVRLAGRLDAVLNQHAAIGASLGIIR